MSLGIAIAIHPQLGSTGAPEEPVLPDGALAVWYADTYSATRPLVPNSASAVAVSANILSTPRRLFANGNFFDVFSTTVTDNAATGPDGLNQASTVVMAANGRLLLAGGITLTAGTYTLSLYVKRNTGTDQPFRTSFDFSQNKSHTATSAWTRVTHTVTVGTGLIDLLICWTPDASTTANIQICDVTLNAGSSDLGAGTLDAHLMLGKTSLSGVPTYASGWLDCSSGGYGIVQFPATESLTAWTVMAVISKVAAGTSYQAILSKISDFQNYSAYTEQDLAPKFHLNGIERYDQAAGLWPLLSDGPHILTHCYDGTNLYGWLDDVRLYHSAPAGITSSLADLFFAAVNSPGFTTGCKFNSALIADVAWTNTELATAREVLTNRAAASAITITPVDRVYCAEGDSITAALNAYPFIFGPNASPTVFGADVAVGGSTLANLNSRAAALDATLPTNRTGRKFILSVLIGANDLGSYSSAANYITDLAAYCDARRAAGWLLVVCTLLPRANGGDSATFNTRRAVVNPAILTWVGTHADAVSDFAGNATMGPDAAASDTTYYSDGLHPTAAGQAILETVIRPVINAL